jgi:hypothetical protein
MFAVQKNIPIPKVNHAPKTVRRKYPFEDMDVGDMFFVPEKTTSALGAHISNVAKKLGRRFSSRQTTMKETRGEWRPCDPDDKGAVVGVGVWRTK